MFRRRKKFPFKTIFWLMAVTFLIAGFYIGYYQFSPSPKNEIPFANDNNVEYDTNDNKGNTYGSDLTAIEKGNETTVTYLENSINPETKVIYRTYYNECDDTLDKVEKPSSDIIGLKEEGLESYLMAHNYLYDIVSFSVDEILLIENRNEVCPQHYDHYLITQKDGYVAIYYYNHRGVKSLIEKTSIPISILPLVDQEKLSKGIIKKTKSEVYQLLEDFSS